MSKSQQRRGGPPFAPSGPENGRAPNGKMFCEFLVKKRLKRPEKWAVLVFQCSVINEIETDHRNESFYLVLAGADLCGIDEFGRSKVFPSKMRHRGKVHRNRLSERIPELRSDRASNHGLARICTFGGDAERAAGQAPLFRKQKPKFSFLLIQYCTSRVFWKAEKKANKTIVSTKCF